MLLIEVVLVSLQNHQLVHLMDAVQAHQGLLWVRQTVVVGRLVVQQTVVSLGCLEGLNPEHRRDVVLYLGRLLVEVQVRLVEAPLQRSLVVVVGRVALFR